MKTEDKAKAIEKALELKRAFLDVKVSFGKGNKYSEDVKKQVSEAIREFCVNSSEGSVTETASVFSEEEISVLRQLVQTVKAKTTKPESTPAPAPEGNSLGKLVRENMRPSTHTAQVLFLDNVDPTLRQKIPSGAIVRVIGRKDEANAFVETMDQRTRFIVPFDDLNFEYEKEQM